MHSQVSYPLLLTAKTTKYENKLELNKYAKHFVCLCSDIVLRSPDFLIYIAYSVCPNNVFLTEYYFMKDDPTILLYIVLLNAPTISFIYSRIEVKHLWKVPARCTCKDTTHERKSVLFFYSTNSKRDSSSSYGSKSSKCLRVGLGSLVLSVRMYPQQRISTSIFQQIVIQRKAIKLEKGRECLI